MRNPLFLLLLGAGVVAGLGCGDDTTATGGGGSGGGDGGNPSTGGGGNPSTGGGGQAQGGGGQAQGGDGPGGMGPGYSCEAAVGTVGTITLEDVASVGTGAVQLKSAPGDPERLYIVKQDGQILIYEDGTLNPTPFLDVSDLIRGGVGGEEGLLGLAFHPDFATNGRFFIHYSANGDGDSTVGEFHATPGATTADPDQVQLVLSHFTDEGNHNGGAVEFGNDGYLYISLGDGGAQNDPGCDAQNLGNLLGKIIRVDVDATPDGEGYPAAAGNPDGEKYYHVGFRNPWRMSFDVLPGAHPHAAEVLGRARLPRRPALQLRGRRGHVQPRHLPARPRPRAVERRLRRALAPPSRRPLRRQPQPPAAVPPVPGDPEAEPARHPGPLPRVAARHRHRAAEARRALRRGRLGVAHARRLGPRLAGVARRPRDLPVHVLPAGRRHRLPPVSGELTYGLERIAMYLQDKDSVYDLDYGPGVTYGEIYQRAEWEWSTYNFEEADVAEHFARSITARRGEALLSAATRGRKTPKSTDARRRSCCPRTTSW
jgi:hypothetical protein